METVEPGIFHRAVSIIDPAVGRKRGVRHPAVLQVIAQFDVGADFLVPSFVVAAMTVPAFRVKGVVGSADLSQPVAVLHVVFGADRIVEVVIVVVFLIGKAFKIELVADFRTVPNCSTQMGTSSISRRTDISVLFTLFLNFFHVEFYTRKITQVGNVDLAAL